MLSTLQTLWGAIAGGAASLLNALFKWAGVIGAYFLGRRSQQRSDLEEAAKVKDRQLKAATKAPQTKEDIIDAARRGGL